MARIKRKYVLAAIRAAGYHGDHELARLLYIKNWVSFSAYKRAFETGAAVRRSGVRFDCSECGAAHEGALDLPKDELALFANSRIQPTASDLAGPVETVRMRDPGTSGSAALIAVHFR